MDTETTKGSGLVIPVSILLSVMAVMAGIYFIVHTPAEAVHWMSVAQGEQEWAKGQKPILYDFCATWCGPCNQMKEEVFGDKAVADKINQFFIPVRVLDRSREEGRNPDEVQALDAKYAIRGFPTLIVRMPGDRSQDLVGYHGREATINYLQGALALWTQASTQKALSR